MWGQNAGRTRFSVGRAGLWGGLACPLPALTASCFLLSGQREGVPACAARPLATPKGALPEDTVPGPWVPCLPREHQPRVLGARPPDSGHTPAQPSLLLHLLLALTPGRLEVLGVGGGGRPGHGCPWTPPGLLRLEGKGSQGCVPCPALPLCEEAGAAALSSG